MRPLHVFPLLLVCLFVLSACPRTAPFPTDTLESRELIHNGLTRTFELSVPPAKDGEPYPVVIALHRFAETGQLMGAVTGFHVLGAKEGFITVYPDGIDRRFDFDDSSGVDDVGFIEAIVDALAAEFAIDRSRLYVTGASNGGLLTWRMACQSSDTFAAFAPVMSTTPVFVAEACAANRGVPIFYIHGAEDPLFPPEASHIQGPPGVFTDVLPYDDTLTFWAGLGECATFIVEERAIAHSGDTSEVTRFTNCLGESTVTGVFINGAGHTWPGGFEPFPRFIVGPQTPFDGTRNIWDFFKMHRLSAAPSPLAR